MSAIRQIVLPSLAIWLGIAAMTVLLAIWR